LHKIWPTHCLVGDKLVTSAEARSVQRIYRRCVESHFKIGGQDKLNLHIENSTRGHDVIADVRDALILWKQNWRKVHKVEKSVKIVDAGADISV
jgi:hypothetical protein